MNELLNMYIENNNKFKKNVQTCKELKMQLERAQLNQERSEYMHKTIQAKYNDLEVKYNEVNSQMATLQKKYNETLISTQTSIQDMQMEVEMLKGIPNDSPDEGESIQDLKKKIEEQRETEEQISKDNLRQEKEIISLQQQIVHNKEEYMKNLQVVQTEKDEITSCLYQAQTQHKEQLKKHTEICHLKDMKINQLEDQLSGVGALNDLVKLLKYENEQLKHEKLVKMSPKSVVSVAIQTEEPAELLTKFEFDESDVSLSEIFEEMINYTTLLSPLRLESPQMEYSLDSIERAHQADPIKIKVDITPTLNDNHVSIKDGIYENCVAETRNVEDDDYMLVDSGISSFCTPVTPLSDINKEYFCNSSNINNFEEISKNRNGRKYKKARYGIQKRRNIYKTKHFVKRKKKLIHSDPVITALKALKQSNINFIISNEEIFSSIHSMSNKQDWQEPEAKSPEIEYLTCTHTNCKPICMLVEDDHLLGFFESNSKSLNQINCRKEKQHKITSVMSKKLPDGYPEVVLNKLAELVSEKLRHGGIQRPSTACNSEYISESEAELRSLFSTSRLDSNEVIESDINMMDIKLINDELVPRKLTDDITLSTEIVPTRNKLNNIYSAGSEFTTGSSKETKSNYDCRETNDTTTYECNLKDSVIILKNDTDEKIQHDDNKIETMDTCSVFIEVTDKETEIKSVKECSVNMSVLETDNIPFLDNSDLSGKHFERKKCPVDDVEESPSSDNFNNKVNNTTGKIPLINSIEHYQNSLEGANISKEPPDKTQNSEVLYLTEESSTEKALNLVISESKIESVATVNCTDNVCCNTGNDFSFPGNNDKTNANTQEDFQSEKSEYPHKYSPKLYSDELADGMRLPLPLDKDYNEELSYVPREATVNIDLPVDEATDRCLIQNLSDFNNIFKLNVSSNSFENKDIAENEDKIFNGTFTCRRDIKHDNSPCKMSPTNILNLYRKTSLCISPLSPDSALDGNGNFDVEENSINDKSDKGKEIYLNTENMLLKEISPLKQCKNLLLNKGESCMSDSTLSPISKCINYILKHEQILTTEVDSFLKQFESNKSFSELNNSIQGEHGPPNKDLTDISSKSPSKAQKLSSIKFPIPFSTPRSKAVRDLTNYFKSPKSKSQQTPNKNSSELEFPIPASTSTSVHIPAGLAVLASTCTPVVVGKHSANVLQPNKHSSSVADPGTQHNSPKMKTSTPISPISYSGTTRSCELFSIASLPIPKPTYGLSSPVLSLNSKVSSPESPDHIDHVREDATAAKIIPLERIEDHSLVTELKQLQEVEGSSFSKNSEFESINDKGKDKTGNLNQCLRSKYGRVIKVKKHPDFYDNNTDNSYINGGNKINKLTKNIKKSASPTEETYKQTLEARDESKGNEEVFVDKMDATSCNEYVKPLCDEVKKSKPVKKLTKLQNSVKRQMRQTQDMFRQTPQSNTCDVKLEKSDPPEEKEKEGNNKKIKIVQNVIIPSNSNSSIDILNSKGRPSPHHDSVHTKHKSLGQKQDNVDVVSSIMSQMDKIRSHKTVIKNEVPKSINEKDWRNGLLHIAETIYNRDMNMPNIYGDRKYDRRGILSPGAKLPNSVRLLLRKFVELPHDEDLPESILYEFMRFGVDNIIDMIIFKLRKDTSKPENFYPAPMMTPIQRKFLRLLIQLEHKRMNIIDKFYCRLQYFVCRRGMGLKTVIPLTRLFMGVCRLQANINMMRTFCCEAFYYAGDMAIPILFTVLTSWTDIIPLQSEVHTYPMAKVLVQLVHLKKISNSRCNSYLLRALLNQYYGYPRERRDCDELFQEVYQDYLENPCPATEYAIRLYLKHKEKPWVYKKLNELFKPLIYKIPPENSNFKATNIVLVGKTLKYFRFEVDFDRKCLLEMKLWFEGLLEDNLTDPIVKQSIQYSLDIIPAKLRIPNAEFAIRKKSKSIPKSKKKYRKYKY